MQEFIILYICSQISVGFKAENNWLTSAVIKQMFCIFASDIDC